MLLCFPLLGCMFPEAVELEGTEIMCSLLLGWVTPNAWIQVWSKAYPLHLTPHMLLQTGALFWSWSFHVHAEKHLLFSLWHFNGTTICATIRSLVWSPWNSNPLTTWCKELTPWKRCWCWERLKAGGEGDNWWWDGWMASLTWWTWVWASSGSWWWTGKSGVLQSMELQRVRYDWATELNLEPLSPNIKIKQEQGGNNWP